MTTTRRTRIAIAAGVAALAIAVPRAAEAAEAFYGVTDQNWLITFNSDAPGAVRSASAITGLAPGENALGIDVRPATGQLYVLGSTSRLYIVSPASGAAVAVGGGPFSPPLAGTQFGFDFNPAVDRIRETSDGRQNLRLNPEDGAVAAQDPNLAYAAGDAAENANPAVSAIAYTPDGATLFGIDTARDFLVTIDPPNDGKLKTRGGLGVALSDPVSADVAADGALYVSGADNGVRLYRADLNENGLLSQTGPYARISTAYGTVRGITAAGPVADDDTRAAVLIGVDRRQSKARLRGTLRVPVSCSEGCAIKARVVSGKRTVARGTGDLAGAGRTTLRVKANKRGRALGKAEGARRLVLRVTVHDLAGNRTRARRTLTFE